MCVRKFYDVIVTKQHTFLYIMYKFVRLFWIILEYPFFFLSFIHGLSFYQMLFLNVRYFDIFFYCL